MNANTSQAAKGSSVQKTKINMQEFGKLRQEGKSLDHIMEFFEVDGRKPQMPVRIPKKNRRPSQLKMIALRESSTRCQKRMEEETIEETPSKALKITIPMGEGWSCQDFKEQNKKRKMTVDEKKQPSIKKSKIDNNSN